MAWRASARSLEAQGHGSVPRELSFPFCFFYAGEDVPQSTTCTCIYICGQYVDGLSDGSPATGPSYAPGTLCPSPAPSWAPPTLLVCSSLLDVQSAYYTVIREMSVGPIECDESVAKVFAYFGLAPDDVAEFWGDIRDGGIMGQSSMPGILRHLAKDIMHQSWFVTGHGTSARLCVTKAGSRPGEAWADLVFAYVLGKILCRIREAAAGEGLLQELHFDADSGPQAKARRYQPWNVLGLMMRPFRRPTRTQTACCPRPVGCARSSYMSVHATDCSRT